MDFKAPFTTFFDHPQWKNNWLLVTVCTLIPLVGPMVVSGWILRCFAAWLDERPAPAFDFQYFTEYLKQGLWPTLVSMVLIMAAMLFIMPLSFGAIFAVASILEGSSDGAGVVIALVLVACIILLELLLFAIMGIIVTPAILRSGLRQDFASGFSLKFILDFLKRCWGPLLLAQLALIVMWIAAIVIGYLALFIGVYFTISLMTFVQWHLHYQVYRTYLARGGAEIPLHPSLRPAVPPPLAASPAPPRLPA